MKRLVTRNYRLSLGMALAFLLLALLLACGPGEEPTPVPTPTKPAAVATPTPTPQAVVASPTPTTVAAPSPTPTPGVQPQRGGKLTWWEGVYVSGFDLYATHTGGSPSGTRWWAKLHNNLLINYGNAETVECEICSEYHWDNNGKTMVFTLIPGIKFQDGREMTSADVKYSLRMIMGEVDGVISPRGGVVKEYIQSIDTPSKYEVRLNLFRPAPFLIKALSIEVMMMIPEGTTREALKTNYYGSGPFILKKTVSGSSWSMERNPNYWKPGLPYLDGFEIVVVPEQATRIAGVMTGQADYFIGPPGGPPPQYRPQFAKLAAEGKVYLTEQPIYCGHNGVFINHGKPPMSDLNFRKALNLALDNKVLNSINNAEYGTAHVLGFGNSYFGQPESAVWDVYPGWGTGAKKQQEIEEAKKLMATYYPNGVDLKQLVIGAVTAASIHEPIQQMLGVVGIRTTLDIGDAVSQLDRMGKGDYNFVHYGQCIPTLDPDEAIATYYLAGGSRNWSNYVNPEIDRLFLLMSSELDPPKRRDLFNQMKQVLVIEDVIYAHTTQTKAVQVFQARVQGFLGMENSAHFSTGFERADRLWVKQ